MKNYEDITVVPIFSLLPIRLHYGANDVHLFLSLNIGPVFFYSTFDLTVNVTKSSSEKRTIQINNCGIQSVPNNQDFYKFDDASKITSATVPSRKITSKQILGWLFLVGWGVALFL